MASLSINFFIYWLILGFSTILGAYRFAKFKFSFRIIFFLILFTFISETLTRLFEFIGIGKTPIYHFYSIISFFIIVMYFIRSFDIRARSQLTIFASILLPLLGYLNCRFFQPLDTINSNILILKSFIIIILSLYALYKILLNDDFSFISRY